MGTVNKLEGFGKRVVSIVVIVLAITFFLSVTFCVVILGLIALGVIAFKRKVSRKKGYDAGVIEMRKSDSGEWESANHDIK